MKTEKIISGLLAAAICWSFTGCGTTDENTGVSPAALESVTTAQEMTAESETTVVSETNAVTEASTSTSASSGSKTVTIVADFGNDIRKAAVEIEGEVNALSLADALSKWTGLDFIINRGIVDGNAMYLDWSGISTLTKGLDDRTQKEGFVFQDTESLNYFMMDTLATTLKACLGVSQVYYSCDGNPLTAKDTLVTDYPIDIPYEGREFVKEHFGNNKGYYPEETQKFLGTWVSGRASMTITDVGDGLYIASISWGNSAFESVEWSFMCDYDVQKDMLVCRGNGTKEIFTYNSSETSDVPTVTTEYTGGSATFRFVNGTVIWNEEAEGSHGDLVFEAGK